MKTLADFKAALAEAAGRKEDAVRDWIEAKKATYPSEDAFYSDPASMAGINEITMLRDACDFVAKRDGWAEADATMLFVCLHLAWNDTFAWIEGK